MNGGRECTWCSNCETIPLFDAGRIIRQCFFLAMLQTILPKYESIFWWKSESQHAHSPCTLVRRQKVAKGMKVVLGERGLSRYGKLRI